VPGGSGTFLTAEWRHLVLLNWAVDPALLQPRVPAGTELDTWDGQTYVSVVGFLFLETRVLGLAVPFHRNFEEVNLRFYVRRRHPDGDRRAVTFVREIVPRLAVATAARVLYNEAYVALPMRHRVDLTPRGDGITDGGTVEYGWSTGGRWNAVGATVAGTPRPLVPGSHEEFIAEHYWGYARGRRPGSTVEYRVLHPPWRVWQTASAALDADAGASFGAAFGDVLRRPPDTAFVAEGSPVAVYHGRRLTLPTST
jgi:uncharacterized protein YqjF (DUF2071 family)